MDAAPGPAGRFAVALETPAVLQEVPMPKLRTWLDGGGKSPSEQAVKVRLRDWLGRPNALGACASVLVVSIF